MSVLYSNKQKKIIMNIPNFFKNIFDTDISSTQDLKLNNTLNLIYLLSWFGSFVFPLLFIVDLINENYMLAVSQLFMFFVFSTNIYLIRTKIWRPIFILINTLLIFAFLMLLFIFGGTDGNGRIWIICFPVINISGK